MQRTIGRFLDAVRQTVAATELLTPGAHVLVALSGGADSTATLAALALLARRLGITVSAAHVHHGLRGAEADRDAACARALAEHFAVPFHLARLRSSLRHGGNLEERARARRYRALGAIARRCGADNVATGHTRDDQAETVILRIVRGCGPSGLSAILPALHRDGVRVIRPLLDCTRAEVEAFVADLGLSYCDDRSNRDRRFLRNRIRLDVLPLLRELNPQIDRALANLASLSREREASRADGAHAQPEAPTVTALAALPAPRRGVAVRRWLVRVRGNGRGLSKRHVAAVLTLLGGTRPSRRIEVPGGAVVRRYDELRFVRTGEESPASLLPPTPIRPGERIARNGWQIEIGRVEPAGPRNRLPHDLWEALVDAETASTGLLVRHAVSGDRVRPHGMIGRRKLADVFVDRKVPRALRPLCPVVQAGSDVLWVPGVVRAAVGLVGPHTRRVIRLRAKSAAKPLLG